MISLFGGGSSKGLVGVEISDGAIAIAHIRNRDNQSKLEHCELLIPEAHGELPREQFLARIQSLGLDKAATTLVLNSDLYTLLLVEAPNVPEEELSDAIRFRVKDMINFPVSEALVDVFTLPADSNRSGRTMAYAVAAQESRLTPLLSLIAESGLKLAAIDIPEMGLRDLAELGGGAEEGVAWVRVMSGRGILVLMRANQVYLTRQFKLAYNAGLFDELPEDQLALELQRSLDYYERQMGQVPPRRVVLCGENITPDKIGDGLRRGISVPLELAELKVKLEQPGEFEESLLQSCAGAIGGALRAAAD